MPRGAEWYLRAFVRRHRDDLPLAAVGVVNPRRRWVPFAGIALLLAIGLPWYRDPGSEPEIWWGLPDWLVVAALCFLGVAALNAYAWWSTDWDDDTPEAD